MAERAAPLRRRLFRIASLPTLAVGALAAAFAGLSVKHQADAEVATQLEFASRAAVAALGDIADRMAGHGIGFAQRRDVQAAVHAGDSASLQRELNELYWDLRGHDMLLRSLVIADAGGTPLALGLRGRAFLADPALIAQGAEGTRLAGLLPADGLLKVGAVVPITGPWGEVRGVLQAAAAFDGALAQEAASRLRGHVALFSGGELRGSSLALEAELPAWVQQALRGGDAAAGLLTAGGATYRALLRPVPDVSGNPAAAHVAVFREAAALEGPMRQAAVALGLTGAVLLFGVLPLTWAASRRLAHPLEALAGTLGRLSARDLEAPPTVMPPGTPDEIRALAEAVERFRDSLREREELASKLSWMANFDRVTRIPNRNLFHDRLGQALAVASRNGTQVAVHIIDLDRFKEVNDTMGHAAGDAVLLATGERLARAVRASDTAARLGGDEFAVVQTNVTDPRQAAELAARLVRVLSGPVTYAGREALIGASIGVSLSSGRGPDAGEAAQREADLALYRAKNEGRNGFRLFDEGMDLQARERRELEADLNHALVRGELRLVFQPQFALPSRRLCGAEALLRWDHPARGDIRPDMFISLAEQSGLIVPIGEWVLREAARVAAEFPGLRIAANVSPVQLRHPGFLDALGEAAATAPGALEIEVTEGVMVADTEATIALFDAARALGVRIALDDFGTGYSSLAQLQRFRFDKIKLDRAFVAPLGRSDTALTLLRAVAGMTRALGVRLNAEGVETEAQAMILAEEGCAEAQGFLLGRPLEAGVFAALAREEVRAAA